MGRQVGADASRRCVEVGDAMSLRCIKVCCFVALPHHSRFMWPVLVVVCLVGVLFLFFTTLADNPFERDVMKRGAECCFLFCFVLVVLWFCFVVFFVVFFVGWLLV